MDQRRFRKRNRAAATLIEEWRQRSIEGRPKPGPDRPVSQLTDGELLAALCERQYGQSTPKAAFADRDLVFFDPDNGLEVQSAKGRRRSKYVLLDEVADHYGAGRSVLVYQDYGKSLPRRALVKEKATTLRTVLAGASVSAFETAHVVFLLAANREHAARVAPVAGTIDERGWTPKFFAAARHTEHTD